jgi:hypothetical protein
MSCCDTKHPMTTTGGFSACVPGALAGGLARTRFFDGMVLTQADLEAEQRFWRVKRRLTNRALGTGVVWGLRLRWDARRRIFVLGPGYALDCCGNDLVVECPTEVSEASLLATADPELRSASSGFVTNAAASRVRRAGVVLQYVECPEEPRPVHLDPCAPPSSRCEPSRIRETTRLLLVPPRAPAEPDCLDDFYADLEDFRAGLSPDIVDDVFPAPSGPAPVPATTLPIRLVITAAGDPPATMPNTREFLNPPANTGTTPATVGPLAGVRVGGGNRGVITFRLSTTGDWAFSSGQVTNGTDVVDEVGAPRDFHLMWPLEIVIPDGPGTAGSFTYVATLGIERTVGGGARGQATLTLTGNYAVSRTTVGNGTFITTAVQNLSLAVVSDLAAGEVDRGCFERFFHAHVMKDPKTASRDAKLLFLAAAHAFFVDISVGASAAVRAWAALLYRAMWRLVGVDLRPLSEAQRQELVALVNKLFACWCDAMLYPGPRCSDEHHGVYLGTATVGPAGQILTFDMWEQRRQVVLGPWIEHVRGVFGLAPLDVIAARFTQAICCLSGLPVPAMPDLGGVFNPGTGTETGGGVITRTLGVPSENVPIGRGFFEVGEDMFSLPSTGVAHIGLGELLARIVAAIVADNGAELAHYLHTVEGRTIHLVAPESPGSSIGNGGPITDGRALDGLVDATLRRDAALAPLARSAARAATAELAVEVEAGAVPELRAGAELARTLGAAGATLATLSATGVEGLLAANPTADPAAVDDVAARAEAALTGLAEAVAAATRKPAPARPSAVLRDADVRKAIAADAKKRFGLVRARVDAALDRAATRSP